jgi:ribosomal protein S18 acetylase RimI-like enzyme
MVKSKQLKILRKKFEKANKAGFDLPQQPWGRDDDHGGGWPATIRISNNCNNKKDKNDDENENEGPHPSEDTATMTLHSWSSQQFFASTSNGHRFQECLDLFQVNMGDYYRNSSWGLNLEEKRTEWTHTNARFLVLLSKSSKQPDNDMVVVGFCHYRFDYNDETDPTEVVLYVYELQIQDQYKRQGLGRYLMTLLEQLARSMDITKVMLTVFRANHGAMRFYHDILHYSIDDSSPSKHKEFADYEILSKQVLLE